MVALGWGCKKEEETPKPKEDKVVKTEPKVEKQAREVFGIPLPPRVRSMSKNAHYVWVETDMSIKQLHAFYLKALKDSDFEVVRVRNSLRIVGLKPMMAFMQAAYIRGVRSNIRMVFSPTSSITSNTIKLKTVKKGNKVVVATKPTLKLVKSKSDTRKGAPVKILTPDGKLLAPGAKWGVPYTPKPGDPLHKRSMKHNFGKPFGEWQGH